jgi:hypothetical protein
VPNRPGESASSSSEHRLQWLFGAVLLWRLQLPFFASPLDHLFSDPNRHWFNGLRFLDPDLIGAGDPYLYQLWMYLLRTLSADHAPTILLATGVLCAAMPYGWYRALKELVSRRRALGAGIIIGLVPGFFSIYAYFMNETLLLTLTGFAFWLTFRAWRKATAVSYALAVALWMCAVFTRTIVAPMAVACLGTLWIAQGQRLEKAAIAGFAFCLLAVPAGLHAQAKLGFFAPLGNLYLAEIYSHSGRLNITLDAGPMGSWGFGSPSFYNPTFQPFSNWTTDRTGTVAVHIDLKRGRAGWLEELARVKRESTFPWTQRLKENLWYLLLGQSWPDNDPHALSGWLTCWTRWAWPPVMAFVAWGALGRGYRGREWLLPGCALGTLVFLALQTSGIVEGRYRKPIDPVLMAAALLLYYRMRPEQPAREPTP